jgi:hypothetical protein
VRADEVSEVRPLTTGSELWDSLGGAAQCERSSSQDVMSCRCWVELLRGMVLAGWTCLRLGWGSGVRRDASAATNGAVG